MAAVDAERLNHVLADTPDRVVACSGGVDSLSLAAVAHQQMPNTTVVAHAVTPAVPEQATSRVIRYATEFGWNLELVKPREFEDERYLDNPADRCYYCKSHLYDSLLIERNLGPARTSVVLSGTNLDDLGEYRPGLNAATERNVRHPFVEAGFTKDDVRALAVSLDLDAADLPASPCLASRLYTGTRVSIDRLRAVELGERALTDLTGLDVVRCRVRDSEVLVEVPDGEQHRVTNDVLAKVGDAMRTVSPGLGTPELDTRPYRPGRAFVVTADAHS